MLKPASRLADSTNGIDRRTVLQTLGGAGVPLLAGCLGSVGGGTGPDGETIIWNDEAYEYSSMICSTSDGRQTHDVYVSDSSLVADAERLDFWVRHDYEEQAQLEEPGYRVLLHVREEAGTDDHEQYVTRIAEDQAETRGLDTFAWGDSGERHTSGAVHLDPDNELAESANPDGAEVEWDIAC